MAFLLVVALIIAIGYWGLHRATKQWQLSEETSPASPEQPWQVIERHGEDHYTVLETKTGKVFELTRTDASINDVAMHEWDWTPTAQ